MTQEKFYKVTAMCGHVSRNRYIPIDFPVKAESRKEASAKTRRFPRVKHHKKFAILNCVEITKEEYEKLQKINNEDQYLKCKSIQEQRKINGLEDRIISLEPREKLKHDNEIALYKLKKFNEYKNSMLKEMSYSY